MQIEKYIHDLLYEYDCVVVPQLGAWVTQERSAVINKFEGTLAPPAKTISFNKLITENDGLLVSYIARLERISYTEALQKVEHFANNCRLQIQQNQEIQLPSIGKLAIDEADKVQFYPSATNYAMSSYGLSVITDLQPVMRSKQQVLNEVLQNPKKSKTVNVKPTTNINRRSAFIAIAATLLVSVFTPLVYNSWTDSKNRASEQARVDLGISKTVTDVFHKEERTTVPHSTDTKPAVVETIDPAHHQPVSPAEELSIKVSELPETKNTEHDTNSVAEKLVRRPIEKMSNRATNGRHAYTFVLGSFKDKLNAEKTIRRIKNDGYAPTVKLQDSLYRVSVSIFCSQLEMNNYLKQFQRDYHPQVWVVR